MPREVNNGIQRKKLLPKSRRKTYVLAYEDNYASPQYFEELNNNLLYDKNNRIELISLKRQRGDTNSAPNHVFKRLKAYKNEYLTEPGDEFWMIVDRDAWKLEVFREKCQDEQNFHLAITNPCFEFWLLLHCFDLAEFDPAELLENRKLGRKRRFLDHFLNTKLEEGYDKRSILPERFLTAEGLQAAIDQAQQIDQGDIMEVLGSHNYLLLQKLLAD